jgi:hypothetical protein
MHVYYVFGGCLVAWAIIVAGLGIFKEGFPATKTAERVAVAISVLLALATISSAAIGGKNEKNESRPDKAAFVPGR